MNKSDEYLKIDSFNVGEQIIVTKEDGETWSGRVGFFGKDCWTCPPSTQSYIQDGLLLVPGGYFLFCLLYVLYVFCCESDNMLPPKLFFCKLENWIC